MSKERTSLSLDPSVAQFLKQNHVNASGLVNKLVQQYMNGGAGEDIIREFRIQQLESEVDELQSREEQKRQELQKLKSIDSKKTEEQEVALEEAKETLSSTPRDPDNIAIQTKADELDITPEELVEELQRDDQ